MEGFLPSPRDSTPATDIPWLDIISPDIDPGSFYTFPQRRGFLQNTNDHGHLGLVDRPEDVLASLLQSWLFFGLLTEFFQRAIDISQFLSEKTHARQVVCVKPDVFEILLIEWRESLVHLRRSQRTIRKQKITNALQYSISESELFDRTGASSPNSPLPLVALSVKLLINILQSISDSVFADLDASIFSFGPRVADHRSSRFRWNRNPIFKRQTVDNKQQVHEVRKDLIPMPPGCSEAPHAAKILLNRFVANGWCVHQALNICRSYDYSTVNYMSLMERHFPAQVDHRRCLHTEKCVAYNVELSETYKTKHLYDDCQCESLQIPIEKLCEIISKGMIPIIAIWKHGPGLKLEVIECGPWTSYTAFSHVWSDGLGNPFSNAMPTCQLQRLREYILPYQDDKLMWLERYYAKKMRWQEKLIQYCWNRRQTPLDIRYFWMDTLCIPTCRDGPMAATCEDLKLKAINHMAPIYARADRVVVLDSELESLSTPTIDIRGYSNDDEVSARILCSKWMQRSWPLQEGVLGRACHFRLHDRAHEVDSRRQPYRRFGSTYGHLDLQSGWGLSRQYSPLAKEVIRFRNSFPVALEQELQEEIKTLSTVGLDRTRQILASELRVKMFVRAWNSLAIRSTTKPEDSLGIFANLLDFNAYHLRQLPQHERLPTLVRSCDDLPLSLLYNSGPRVNAIDAPGSGWLPVELAGDKLTADAIMKRDNLGHMLVEASRCPPGSFSIYRFHDIVPPGISTFAFTDEDTRNEYIVETNVQNENAASPRYDPELETCIIVDRNAGSSSDNGFLAKGVKLHIISRHEKKILLRYDRPIVIWKRSQWRRVAAGAECCPFYASTEVRSNVQISIEDVNHERICSRTPLVRRPLLPHRPFWPNFLPFFFSIPVACICFTIYPWVLKIWDLLPHPTISDPVEKSRFRELTKRYFWTVSMIISLVCAWYMWLFMRRLYSRLGYMTWIGTFDAGWDPSRRFMWYKQFSAILGPIFAPLALIYIVVGIGLDAMLFKDLIQYLRDVWIK